jgi:alkylation response protein AidB-like acyl-CoA dehydrogenase
MTESFADLRERVRDFIDNEVIPAEPAMDEADAAATAQLEALKAEAKQRGIWALGHPADIGGGGRTFMETALLNEVIGRSFYGQKAVGTWSMQDSLMLKENASPQLRDRWLKPLVAGEIRSSVGLTEPEVAGSDPTLITSTALQDGNDWVINAHKPHDVIDRAIQVHGALGLTPDTPLDGMYRRARYARIYDGPDEVHRYTLARLLAKEGMKAPWHDL